MCHWVHPFCDTLCCKLLSTVSLPHLVLSVRKGNTKELQFLLQNMTSCEFNVNSFNLKLRKLLVKFGADIRLANREGWSSLHIAACGGQQDIVLYLITKAKYSSSSQGGGGVLMK
uniref:Uncharacterized protein n=1 Tax=Leptobrachium leishanense TaxID=445787 RepID=A0A8C5M7D1_9ANUR